MGDEGAFPKLRVFKSTTPGHFPEGMFSSMPSPESIDFRIEVCASGDGKVDTFDFGTLGNLPLLQNTPIITWIHPSP